MPGLDPELAGMLLVHLVAAQLHAPYTAGDPKFGGLPKGLAIEMVANGLFHGHERPDVLLARTRMLVNTYGAQIDLGRLKLRALPLDLLREATGLDFEDMAALTLAYGYIRAPQPGPPWVNAFAGIRASAASQTRSPGSYRTRPACRRSTAFWCRSTSSSASFARSPRNARTARPSTRHVSR